MQFWLDNSPSNGELLGWEAEEDLENCLTNYMVGMIHATYFAYATCVLFDGNQI